MGACAKRLAFCGLFVILAGASAAGTADDPDPSCNLDSDPSNLLQAFHNRSSAADAPDDRNSMDMKVWQEIKDGDAMDIAAGGIGSLVVGAINGESGEELGKAALSTILDLGVAAIAAKAPFVGPFALKFRR